MIAALTLFPLQATAQDGRTRDLGIVESVLVEAIQFALQGTIEQINIENVQAQESARQNDEPVPLRYEFRSAGPTQARGIYLEDYGAIFTVQVPGIVYTVRALSSTGAGSLIVQQDEPDSIEAAISALGAETQMRAQMSRMGSEIAIMRRRLEREVEVSGENSESANALRGSLETWESAFAEIQRAYAAYRTGEEREAERRRQQTISSSGERVSGGELGGGIGALHILTSATSEELAAAEELAKQQRNQIEGSVIDAVIRTLGRYGHNMHDLADDDRLAVVLLPSSYLNPIVSWSRATQRDQEFIISVRYSDVVALDEGTLPDDEFRGRVRIEPRPVQLRQQ